MQAKIIALKFYSEKVSLSYFFATSFGYKSSVA